MSPIGSPLIGTYDYRVVAVSLLLAVITSYAALDIAGRLSAARGLARLAWLSGGALAMGIGLWTSQFMGMEAFQLPMPVRYYWPTVLLLSMVAGIVAAAVGLFAASRNTLTTRAILWQCGDGRRHRFPALPWRYIAKAPGRSGGFTVLDEHLDCRSGRGLLYCDTVCVPAARTDNALEPAEDALRILIGTSLVALNHLGLASVTLWPSANWDQELPRSASRRSPFPALLRMRWECWCWQS